MSSFFDWNFKYPSRRMPVMAKNVVATSQPLASQAGLQMLKNGGNAVDAAISGAIALTVVEPVNNGVGSDAFAIIWDKNELVGLNASGKSPKLWTTQYFSKYNSMPLLGWDSVTVPGAVSAWVELSHKYGVLPFEILFEPAIKYAKDGFLVSPITAELWEKLHPIYNGNNFSEFKRIFYPNNRAPEPGEIFRNPDLANTLKLIAKTEGEAFYHGELAKRIAKFSEKQGGLLRYEDLTKHKPLWEETLNLDYTNVTLHELPPNGQGLAALIMLGIIKNLDIEQYEPESAKAIHLQIEAMKLSFADAYRYISDPKMMEFPASYFLTSDYLNMRASSISMESAQDFTFGIPEKGDTVYLTTADETGMMVSYIQSNYFGFGSGIVIPGTGISLQNRGNCFVLDKNHPNQVGPNKRPYHTIIPAFVMRNEEPLMSFGVMGGSMQPQGHSQMMIKIFDFKQNPQTAIDAPRWRVGNGRKVSLEEGFDQNIINQLKKRGHRISIDHFSNFGGAQIIYRLENGYLAASDPRKDGQAIGY
jgi:gamma-glutamyltranspeptidase/glutathione hydrolase